MVTKSMSHPLDESVRLERLLLVGDDAGLLRGLRLADGHHGALQLRGELALLLGSLSLAHLLHTAREQDQAAAVLLQALHVHLARLHRLVTPAGIHSDADGAGERGTHIGRLKIKQMAELG